MGGSLVQTYGGCRHRCVDRRVMIHPIPAILPPPFKAHRACSSHAASARARRTAPGLNVLGRCKKIKFHFISFEG